MKSFVMVATTNGQPAVDLAAYPLYGYVLAAQIPGFGGYILSGTPAQIAAVATAPGLMEIARVTDLRNGITYGAAAKGATVLTLTGATRAAIVGEVIECLGVRYTITATGAIVNQRQPETITPGLAVAVPDGTPVQVGPATRWGELENAISPAMISRWDTYRAGKGYAAIAPGTRLRDAITQMFRNFDSRFRIEETDVADAGA